MSGFRWNTELDLINEISRCQRTFHERASSGSIVLVENTLRPESNDKQFYLEPISTVDELIELIPIYLLENSSKLNLLLAKHRLSPTGEPEGTYAFGIRSRGFGEVIGLMATDLYFRKQDWLFFQPWGGFSGRIQQWFTASLNAIREEHDDYYTLVYG